MSIQQLRLVIDKSRRVAADKTWFLRWVTLYANRLMLSDTQPIPVDSERAIEFLKGLKAEGKVAWQRLQAVRALEFHARSVARIDVPDLVPIRRKLGGLADKEQLAANSGIVTQDLVGHIDPHEHEVLRRLRRELRLGHDSRRTEQAYTGWVERFLHRYRIADFSGLEHVGEPAIKEFPSELAVEGNVAASTQNQAFSGLLFLFQKVLQRKLEFVDAVRAKQPQRLPAVLSRDEVQRLPGFGSHRSQRFPDISR